MSPRINLSLVVLAFVFSIQVSAQPYQYLDPNNFDGIWSEGTIPSDFTESWATKVQRGLSSGIVGVNNDNLNAFWSENYYFIDQLLQSGSVSFNDPISVYLNNIKDRLLKDDPELAKSIRVYLTRSPFVNAAAVADGMILFHVGAISYAETEAELAFIMAHEIQHYKQGHIMQSFEERQKLLKEKVKEYKDMHPIEKWDLLTMQSQDHEYEADELGAQLYLKSEYSSTAPDRVMTMLHQNYMPYGHKEVGKDFLAIDDFTLPDVFFRDSVSAISREEDYFDETHSHPNIAKRRKGLEEVQKGIKGGDKDFIQPKEQFYALRELARFERVRELILLGYYGDAIYDIYVLRDKYPNSKYLDIAEAKAFYGLAGFKVYNQLDRVIRSTGRIEGPSQQAHHILKQFDRNQMTAYALRVVMENAKKYPNDEYLNMYASELAKYMVTKCKLDITDFKVTEPKLAAFNQSPEDFETERQYLRAVQKHYRSSYKYLVQEEVQSGWLATELKRHEWVRDSINDYINLSRKEKGAQRDERIEKWEDGNDLHVQKLLMLDPSLVLNMSEVSVSQFNANFEKEQEFKNQVETLVNEAGLEVVMLFSDRIKEDQVHLFNQVARLKEQMEEGTAYYKFGMLPPGIEVSRRLEKEGNVRFVCNITGLLVNGTDTYYFGVYDLHKGKWVYSRKESAGIRLTAKDLQREISKDLELIHN